MTISCKRMHSSNQQTNDLSSKSSVTQRGRVSLYLCRWGFDRPWYNVGNSNSSRAHGPSSFNPFGQEIVGKEVVTELLWIWCMTRMPKGYVLATFHLGMSKGDFHHGTTAGIWWGEVVYAGRQHLSLLVSKRWSGPICLHRRLPELSVWSPEIRWRLTRLVVWSVVSILYILSHIEF